MSRACRWAKWAIWSTTNEQPGQPAVGQDAEPRMLRIRIEDVEVPYADLDTLIRSKQTGRLQDRADAETLEELKRLQARPRW